jgi:hypothetical protein
VSDEAELLALLDGLLRSTGSPAATSAAARAPGHPGGCPGWSAFSYYRPLHPQLNINEPSAGMRTYEGAVGGYVFRSLRSGQ